jgi:hypothetical protein
MSESHLPDDLARWPGNPYELLGVQPGVSPHDLRRAYTGLIRVYKPEQFPEHFRRIREAYEAILQHVEASKYFAEAAGGGADTATPTGVDSSVKTAAPSALDTELQALWERAVAGEETFAYQGLQDITARHPGRADVYLRLYWLLALCPELEAGRTPFDWLALGARRAGWSVPLMEMIRRESHADPTVATGRAYAELLADFGRMEVLVQLVDWRWDAACRLGQWALVHDDVERLREPVRVEGDDAWVRLLQVALNHLAWAEDAATAAGQYFKELQGLEHLHGRLGQELDQVEFLRNVSGAWQTLRRVPRSPPEVTELVALCWLRPAAEVRPRLLEFLGGIAREPHAWLGRLDMVAKEAPPVLNFLAGVVNRLNESAPPQPETGSGEHLGRVLGEFLVLLKGQKYERLRPLILDFCLREAMPPEAMAAMARGRYPDRLTTPTPLSEMIDADWPVRFICLTHRTLAAWA